MSEHLLFYADNICQMQRSSIERQADRQQRQLAESQASLQTKILNIKFEDEDNLSSKNSDHDTDMTYMKSETL